MLGNHEIMGNQRMMAANRKRPLTDDSSGTENLDDTAKIAKHELENDENFFIDSKTFPKINQLEFYLTFVCLFFCL